MKNGVITKDTLLWSRTYSYYWIMIIEPRRGNSSDPFYQFFDWMVTSDDLEERRREFNDRLAKSSIPNNSK